MQFAQSIFGKELHQITFNDLVEFFKISREESSKVEFKSGETALEDIYREICAFLNTEGGLLIIGAPIEEKVKVNSKSTKRVCIGELTPSNIRNKGWLIQKISSNISPFPSTLDIQEILTENGNFYIIDVPQSQTPPHQCLNEGKYYIRLEEEARPAPHGIVQALFFQRQKPLIKTKLELYTLKNKPKNEIEIRIKILNESDFPTENISFIIDLINIENVQSDDYHENSHGFKQKNDIFTLRGVNNQVLVRELSLPIEFLLLGYAHATYS